jgi:hypothetical protein
MKEAACVRDSLILCLDVHQRLWDCDTAQTDFIKEQIGNIEVHTCVEMGVRADS